MSESPDNKVCRACAETIKANARLCPFCQTRQRGFPIWQIVPAGSMLLLFAAVFSALYWLDNDEDRHRGPEFAPHRQALQVVRTSIELARQTSESWFAGVQTNLWPTRELEVRFLDPDGSPLATRLPEGGAPPVGPCFWLSGFITNAGMYSWSAKDLEVRFLDARSNLVNFERVSFSESLRIPPHRELAFRAPFDRLNSTRTNLARQVRVQTATCAD